MRRLSCLLIIMSVISCDHPVPIQLPQSKVVLEFSSQLQLPLDGYTVQNSKKFKFFRDDSTEYLSFFNGPDNSIKIYSVEEQELIKSIKLKMVGPDRIIDISGSPDNFNICSLDMVYVYSPMQESIFQVNSEGKIIDSWNVESYRNNEKIPAFDIETLCDFYDMGSYFLLTGRVSWFDDGEPPITIVPKDKNLKQRQIPESFPIYEDYPLDKLGNANFFKASNTQMKDGSTLINYPLDHRLTKLNLDESVEYIELKNPYVGELKVFGKYSDPKTVNSQEYFDYQSTAAIYQAVLFDEYRNYIYRIGRIEVPRAVLEKVKAGGERRSWDFSIMIYDDDFNFLGETTIENTIDYDFRSIFINKDGLNVRRRDADEDLLVFDTFQVKSL